MLTPAFELSQDEVYLSVIIKAKFAKVADTEIYVDGDEFKFYSSPYYLRLTLPGRIVEDGRESAKYDADTGYFVLKFPKENPGEQFEGLDMLTKLLAPKGQVSAAMPLIEVVGEEVANDSAGDIPAEEKNHALEEEEEFDWQIQQHPVQDLSDVLLQSTAKYGFANQRSGVFQELREEFLGVVDIPDPDSTNPSNRRKLRMEAEIEKFDDDHYLADLYQDEMIQPLLDYQPPWSGEYQKFTSQQSQCSEKGGVLSASQDIVKFTEEEKEKLRKLPNKEYLLDKPIQTVVFFGLVDIIFAYAYNHRVTEGENSVESAWTICKLSSTLSWLDTFSSLHDVVIACHRRALCYPLHRHWKLVETVYQDVQQIFSLGRRRLLKCLLEVRQLLSTDDTKYILNDLYLTDYCVWIQSTKKSMISSLAKSLSKVNVNKSDVELDLVELEHAARLVQEDDDDPAGNGEDTAIHQYGYPCVLTAEGAVERSNDGLVEQIARLALHDDGNGEMDDTGLFVQEAGLALHDDTDSADGKADDGAGSSSSSSDSSDDDDDESDSDSDCSDCSESDKNENEQTERTEQSAEDGCVQGDDTKHNSTGGVS